jgi:hypothetical protein
MRPLRRQSTTATLESLSFKALPLPGDCPAAGPARPPIAIEDNAFSSWWQPTWRERVRLLLGAPVRVLVNYSLHGPLDLDTQSRWGAPSARDW